MSSIPYLDNIETTSIKIFAETPEISGKNRDLRYNRNYSNCLISLNSLIVFYILCVLSCDRILEGKYPREWGSLGEYYQYT